MKGLRSLNTLRSPYGSKADPKPCRPGYICEGKKITVTVDLAFLHIAVTNTYTDRM